MDNASEVQTPATTKKNVIMSLYLSVFKSSCMPLTTMSRRWVESFYDDVVGRHSLKKIHLC